MKTTQPFQLAAIIGALCALLTGIELYAACYFDLQIEPHIVALISISIGLISFGLSWLLIEKFIHAKIKVIYRSILGREVRRKRASNEASNRDELMQAQKDVEEWAVVKQGEIETLREQAKYRREFIGNLAHELRTPIFNMQGYLLTLIEGGLNDPKINKDYLRKADQNLDRLIALVEDLESISNLEWGRDNIKPERADLVKLVKDAFDLFELRAKKKKVKLVLNYKEDKPIWVSADKSRMLQVFSNLIINAINYGKDGGRCEVQFLDLGNSVVIEVSDDGIGIEEKDIKRIFERFYRVDKSRSRHQGGTGLGLAIVKHILEAHHQTINVRSTPGEGTTFSFALPKSK